MRTLILLLLSFSTFAQLPTTGSLSLKNAAGAGRSISQQVDGNETGNKSLTTLSGTAVFTAPHSMLEFRGYPATISPDPLQTCVSAISTLCVGGIDISWTYAAGGATPTFVRIEKSINSGAYAQLVDVTYPATSYNADDITAEVTPGATHVFRLSVFNSNGGSTTCTTSLVTLPLAPGAVSNVTGINNYPSGLIGDWDMPTTGGTPVVAFHVQLFDVTISDPVAVFLVETMPPYTWTYNLTEGHSYEFHVLACSPGGIYPIYVSSSATFYGAPPEPVSNLTTNNINPLGIELGWNAPTTGGDVTNYRVEMSELGGPFSFYKDTGIAVTTTVFDADLVDGNDYQFRVRSENAAGNSTYVTSTSIFY